MIRLTVIAAAALMQLNSAAAYSCKAVEVLFGEGRKPLKGIEDLVLHPPSGALILSAHDRWGDRDGDETAVHGLFRVHVGDVLQHTTVEATNARTHVGARAAMKPHGLALRQMQDKSWHLLAINHHALNRETTETGAAGTTIEHYVLDGQGNLAERKLPLGQPALCPANDLDFLGDNAAIVTLDRTNCGGFWRFLELARGQYRGKLARIDLSGDGTPEILMDGLGFPNGVQVHGEDIFVAFSREKRLARYRLEGPRLIEQSAIELPGGGDNLSRDSQGRLLVPVHPNLFDFGLYTYRTPGWDSAPTLMLAMNGADGPPEVLFEDPEGTAMAGVTSFIEVDGRLIGGAAFDDGLLVCEPEP